MTEMNCEFKICEEINDEPVIVSTNTKTKTETGCFHATKAFGVPLIARERFCSQ